MAALNNHVAHPPDWTFLSVTVKPFDMSLKMPRALVQSTFG